VLPRVRIPRCTGALARLRRSGFAARNSHGHYALGDKFVRLAFDHHEARPDHLRIAAAPTELAERYGETAAHYAVLDGDTVVYRAKVDPPYGARRLTSAVGGRSPVHSTGVGKLLLAYVLPDNDAVVALASDRMLERPF
jgi:DNA-binding IclR family transcriptional regulator